MACRALIAYFNEGEGKGEGSYDVVYEANPYGQAEEGTVAAARIAPLEDFEVLLSAPTPTTVLTAVETFGNQELAQELTPLLAKERGNRLFQLRDYDAAKAQYARGLQLLTPPMASIGSRAIVLNKLGEFVSGTLSNVEEEKKCVDIIYDDEDEHGVDEEDGVSQARVVLSALDAADRALQISLFMNLAKVSLKFKRNGWAIRYSSSAIGIINSDNETSLELAKKLLDAHYFRCKVFLIVNRPGRALADVSQIHSLGDAAKAETLRKQIAQHKEQTRRADRKLARDIGKWVESAMAEPAAAAALGGGGSEDAMIEDDY
jgi:hypothetical protein